MAVNPKNPFRLKPYAYRLFKFVAACPVSEKTVEIEKFGSGTPVYPTKKRLAALPRLSKKESEPQAPQLNSYTGVLLSIIYGAIFGVTSPN